MSFHYRNSVASTSLWEPVYLNHFEAILTPPPQVANWEFVIPNLKSVSGLDVDRIPEPVQQFFKGAPRSYAGGYPSEISVDISMSFEVNVNDENSMYVYRALRQWTDLVFDPLTGEMGLKADYVGGPLQITLFNKAQDIFRKYRFPVVFPSAPIPAIELDYQSTDIYVIEGFQLRADYWEDTII